MRRSSGRLIYGRSDTGGYRCAVEIDPEIVNLTFELIPHWMKLQRQKYAPHITVVRADKEVPPKLSEWERFHNASVWFVYDTYVYANKTYMWLQVECEQLQEIRLDMGLPPQSEWTRPPDGAEFFHITVGNFKHGQSHERVEGQTSGG